MPDFYSQHGEDFILWHLFQNQSMPGYFVEVGALDGTRFSNTYTFEREGWSGVCVEAHPDYIEMLKKNRPKSYCVWAAAGESNGEVTFYANSRGSLSTLDPSLEEKFRREYGSFFTGFRPVTVPIKTLNQILSEANAPVPLDFVSIDVEGAEMRVLQGFDLDRFQPRILILEAMDSTYEEQLHDYLTVRGYHRARLFVSNLFYCRSTEDVETLQQANPEDCNLTHTPHPFDLRAAQEQKKLTSRVKTFLHRLRRVAARVAK